ncbi:MAG: polysaccharide deacetylase family protein [Legionellaceae bacterium]|nr:polysaccharide deacetylase family protein [Legionellaceae bacterium]
MKIRAILLLSGLMTMLGTLSAKPIKQVAITIDDLPFVGTTNGHPGKLQRERERFLSIMETLKEKNAPAIGFVIAGSIEKDQWQLLEAFHQSGFLVGNHTYSHPSLHSTSAENYINDIERADKILAPLMDQQKYFRYPYLAESSGAKKQQVLDYLHQKGYQVAPVTIDSKDFRFNDQLFRIPYRQRPAQLPALKKRYLDYIWQQTQRAERISAKNGKENKQILLIHANLINAHAIGDIVDLYRQNGYEIVSLEKVMPKTQAPTSEDEHAEHAPLLEEETFEQY